MASGVVTECHGIRIEPQGHQTGKIRRIPSRLEYIIKQFIIPVKQSQNFSSICTSLLKFGVVMPVATIITAEFLVLASVSYLVSALKTDRHTSFPLLVFHKTNIDNDWQIWSWRCTFARTLKMFFFFLTESFLFLEI